MSNAEPSSVPVSIGPCAPLRIEALPSERFRCDTLARSSPLAFCQRPLPDKPRTTITGRCDRSFGWAVTPLNDAEAEGRGN